MAEIRQKVEKAFPTAGQYWPYYFY